jgi:Ca2+-binding RTX toxin-like protein
VTINQADGQADPAASSPINFTAIFDEPVSGFIGSDVTLSGTAGATTAVVTETAPNDGTTYNVAVSGMTGNGTVVADIPAGVANDADGNPNAASTSTDNTVTFTASAAPSCAGQPATIYVDGQGRIVGGPHNGKLYRGKLHGTSGADVMVGTSGPDEIDGKSGNDRICGLGGNDTLKGGSGNDTLEGGPGADQFKGGSGTDTVIDFNPGQGDTKTSVENF